MNQIALSAEQLAASTAGDPQFEVPPHPALSPGVVIQFLREGLLVDGVVSRRVLKGATVQELLPSLLPLLDGVRDWNDIAEASALPVDAVRQVLGVLFSAGALQDGPPDPMPNEVAAYFNRTFDVTRRHRSGDAARRASTLVRVSVAGVSDTASAIRRLISSTDIDKPNSELMIVVIDDESELSAASAAAHAARQSGATVLPVVRSGDSVVIGPLSLPEFGPCFTCTMQSFPAAVVGTSDIPSSVVAALVAVEATNIAARVGVTRTLRNAVVVSPRPLRDRVEFVPSRPGCSTCSAAPTDSHETPLALAYEQSVAFPPQRMVNPRDHQMHYESENIELQYATRSYAHGQEHKLPLPSQTAPAARDENPLDRLSAVLNYAFGFRWNDAGERIAAKRWAPSGGNLGSPQAFISCLGVPGLTDGRYAYQAATNQLVQLSPAADNDGVMGAMSIELVIASEFGRVWKKYGTFAYRVVSLDAGVALTNIALASVAQGFQMTNHTSWDEDELDLTFKFDRSTQIVSARLTLSENI